MADGKAVAIIVGGLAIAGAAYLLTRDKATSPATTGEAQPAPGSNASFDFKVTVKQKVVGALFFGAPGTDPATAPPPGAVLRRVEALVNVKQANSNVPVQYRVRMHLGLFNDLGRLVEEAWPEQVLTLPSTGLPTAEELAVNPNAQKLTSAPVTLIRDLYLYGGYFINADFTLDRVQPQAAAGLADASPGIIYKELLQLGSPSLTFTSPSVSRHVVTSRPVENFRVEIGQGPGAAFEL